MVRYIVSLANFACQRKADGLLRILPMVFVVVQIVKSKSFHFGFPFDLSDTIIPQPHGLVNSFLNFLHNAQKCALFLCKTEKIISAQCTKKHRDVENFCAGCTNREFLRFAQKCAKMWKIFVHFAQAQNRLARTGSEPLMKYCYK
jgi:hypothetical protein